jgi:L-amino acid N-acyltransferase YncA
MKIHRLKEEHFIFVKSIYEEGIATRNATFETEVPPWQTWDKNHLQHSRLVAEENGEVAGWAALTPVSGRCVYAGVAEVSIYIGGKFRGKGIGRVLLKELIFESEKNGLWTLQAGIFPENVSSIKLHEHCGFRKVGFREKVGAINGIWRDTLLFERRSKTVGV